MITRLVERYSQCARQRRAATFRTLFALDRGTRILDLGSENGENIHAVLEGAPIEPRNVYIADIDAAAVQNGSQRYGYIPVVIDEAHPLPFPDGYFDIVYCSSVIEHVTVPKSVMWQLRSGRQFRRLARERQQAFAREIMRLGKCFFVQTPYRHFPIESHSWLPFIAWLPRWLLLPTLRLTNGFWVKSTSPDFHLLDKKELSGLFDGAMIIEERALGMTKSIMAARTFGEPPCAA